MAQPASSLHLSFALDLKEGISYDAPIDRPYEQFMLIAKAISCPHRKSNPRLYHDLHLTLAPQQGLQILGGNGSGKTTLLKTLAGLLKNDTGYVSWNGESLEHPSFAAQRLYLGHKAGLKQPLSAIENLFYFAELRKKHIHNPETLLSQLGLKEVKAIPASRLSAGQQKRLLLSHLLFDDAPLWILDEPFSNLDHPGVALLENLMSQHLARPHSVIVFSSHQTHTLPFTVQTLCL